MAKKLSAAEQARLEELEAKYANHLSDEEHTRLQELEAKYAPAPKMAADGLPEGLFAPEPTVVVPNQSLPYQAGATVMGLANRMGTAKIADKLGVPNVVEQTRAAKANYPANFNLGENIARAAPTLAVPAAGSSLGAPGLVVTGKQALMANAAVAGAEGTWGSLVDVTQDHSLPEAALEGAKDAAMTYAGGKVLNAAASGVSKLASKTAGSLRGAGTKTIDGLKAGLKRLGFENAEIREAGKQALNKEVPSGNPLMQLKTLIDEGIIRGKQTTEQIAQSMDDALAANSKKVAEIVDSPVLGNQVLPTEKNILQLKVNPKQVALRGGADAYRQEAVRVLQREAPGILDNAGNIRSMTRKEAQMLKQGLQAVRGNYGKRVDIDDVTKEVVEAAENHLREVLEETTPELAKLNKVSSAIHGLRESVTKLENKGIDVSQGRLRQSLNKTLSSPFTTGAAGAGLGAIIGPQVGLDSRQGALVGAGLGAGIRAASYPRALQDSLQGVAQSTAQAAPQALPRTLEAIGGFIEQNADKLSAPMIQMLQKIRTMPPRQQEQMLPTAIAVLEKNGVAVEPPKSGYPSEVNGRLTSPEDVISAGHELWQRTDLSILEKSKMWKELNKNGTVPSKIEPDGNLIISNPKWGGTIKITPDGSYGI